MKRLCKRIIWLAVAVCTAASGSLAVFAAATQIPSDIKGHWAESKIKLAVSMGIFDSQPHLLKKFEPNRAMTRAEFCAVLNSLYNFKDEADVTFQDVKADDWFAADIKRAVKAGYLKGDGAGHALPNELLTRAEAAVMLNKIENYPKSTGAAKKFKDYKKIPSWAVESVDACVDTGVIKGDDKGNFRPNDNLTRAEIVALLFNVMGL